jgi:hypothetical protein
MSSLTIRTVGDVLYGQFQTPAGTEIRMRKEGQSWRPIRTLNPQAVWTMVVEHANREPEMAKPTPKQDLATRFARQQAKKRAAKVRDFMVWRTHRAKMPAHEGD